MTEQIAERVAEFIENHDSYHGAVRNHGDHSSFGHWVDLSSEPMGDVHRDLLKEEQCITTRVDSEIKEAATRYWFDSVEMREVTIEKTEERVVATRE